MAPDRSVALHVTRWPVWSMPGRLLAAVLTVEAFTVGLVVADVVSRHPVDRGDLTALAALSAAGVVHTELAHGIERIRRRIADTHHVNLTSVWTFAAAVLLPPLMACAVVVVIYGHLWLRVLRRKGKNRRPAYREFYNVCTVLLAVHAATGVLMLTRPGELYGMLSDVAGLLLALLAYTVVNTCLVLGVVAIASPDVRVLDVLRSGEELPLEIATLCLGALAAGAVGAAHPIAVAFVIPPVLVLHRTILVRQLEEQANTDSKTGLLNAAAWHTRASRSLSAAARNDSAVGLLVIDLDHFKTVNDQYGHLAGDHVLNAVASTLRDEIRDHDLVGRFGGEEFVVLLPRLNTPDGAAGVGYTETRRVAERIRQRISDLRFEFRTPDGPLSIDPVTVSIGGAVHPRDGATLTVLLEAADSAMYAAKRAGRNTVRMGSHLMSGPREVPDDGPATAPQI